MNRFSAYLFIAVLFLGGVVTVQHYRVNRLKKERDRHQQNSDAMLSDMKQWQVDSTTMATDVKSLRFTVDEMSRYRAEDVAKIEQMGVKINNLQSAAKHQLEVKAPIVAPIRDSLIIGDTIPILVKSVSMQTPHIQLSGIIENNSLVGSIHLPVTLRQAVWVEYKRRWLLWKKVVAVHQTITSDNPHVEIKYSEYIIIQN